MKLLFISGGFKAKNHFLKLAFDEMSNIHVVDTYRWNHEVTYYQDNRNILEKISEKLGLPLDFHNANKRINALVKSQDFDIIFVIKGNHLYPTTLNNIKKFQKNACLVNWSLDDMFAKHNRTKFYKYNLSKYDLIVSTKSYNLLPNELPALGAKRILFQNNAYYEYSFLKKISRPRVFKHDVSFIGTAEDSRFRSLNFLAENGIQVKVYGSGWDKNRYSKYHKNLSIECRVLDPESCFRTIANSKISLCFLRKMNRDLQTLRSVEIPAVGGFMIAERTDEHLAMFKDGIEAIFFQNDSELLKNIKFYLNNDNERELIAKNGKKRCVSSYNIKNNLENIFVECNKIKHSQII